MEPDQNAVVVGAVHRAIVRALAPPEEVACILDDLEEEAAQIANDRGIVAARQWVRWQIAHSMAPWIRRRAGDRLRTAKGSARMLHRGLVQDIRLAARRLLQARGFTALAVVTLAIGLGAVSAVFSITHALWLKPLPYRDPDALVFLHAKHESSGAIASLSSLELAEYQRSGALGEVAGFTYSANIMRTGDEPVRIAANRASPNLFRVLGVRPAVGRDFYDGESEHTTRVIMLSHASWTKYFGRDPSVTGRTITLDGLPYAIVGVMPPGFTFPRGLPADAWIPSTQLSAGYQPSARVLQAIGRLASGRTAADAAAELTVRAKAVAAAYPGGNVRWTAAVTPAAVTVSSTSRRAFEALMGIVAVFLLITCGNLGGLLLARNATRRAELALCLSLGAPRWRLARMLLAETTLLAGAGCAAGVWLASYASRVLAALLPARMPGLQDVAISGPVVAVAVAVSFISALLIGLLPVFSLRSLRAAEALSGSRTVARGSVGAQRILVVAEIVMAVVLVVGGSVMLGAFMDLLGRDRGFEPRNLFALNVSLPFSDDSYLPTERRARAFDEMLARVAAVPGVHRAAATTGFPGSPLGILDSAPITPRADAPQLVAAVHASTAGYFETMGIPVRAGRAFATTDTTASAKVALVNELLAREFPKGDPVGARIPLDIQGERETYEIVGVVGDIHLTGRAGYRVFVPLAQASPYWIDLVVRGDGRGSVLPEVRQALRGISREFLIENDSSFNAIISDSVALQRAQSAFAVFVGALSAIVAGVGLYGLMAFAIASRRREMGIRLALGSNPGRLFRETLAGGLRLAATGLVIGVAAAALVVRALSTRVFGLSSADPLAYAGAALLVLMVAVTAIWIPARRVMRTDPLIALRAE